MAGRLQEADYASVRETHDPEQVSLSEWSSSGPTTIAVVRRPGDTGIDEVCDEWWPELGMPEDALDDYWKLRGEYNRNRFVSSNEAANRAFVEADLRERFDRYVRDTPAAQKKLDEIIDRLEDGSDITLVCFESGGKKCHRHLLMDMLERRREASLRVVASAE